MKSYAEEFIRVYKNSYLCKFLTLFYGISYYFSETFTEVVVRRRSSCPEVFLGKGEYRRIPMPKCDFNKVAKQTTDNFIGQVVKIQNSCFKKYLRKVAAVLQRACILRACHEICSGQHPSNSTSIEAHRNTECIDLRFHFPKFRLVRCFTLSAQVYVQGAK